MTDQTESARRKERIAMAREICLHRGENPDFLDHSGNENWEKFEPLAGACIRAAERLFALRDHAQTPAAQVDDETLADFLADNGMLAVGDDDELGMARAILRKYDVRPKSRVSDTSTDR